MVMALGLESVIGINTDICDFVSSAPREEAKTIRDVVRYVFDTKILGKLVKNKQHDLVQARVLKILESEDINEALKIVESYDDLKSEGFRLNSSEFRSLAKLFLEKNLTQVGKSSWKGNGQFVSDVMKFGDKTLVNDYAVAIQKLGELQSAFSLYKKAGNEKGMLGVIMTYYDNYNFPNVARLLIQSGKDLAKTAISEIARRETRNEYSNECFNQIIDVAKELGHIKPIEDVADFFRELVSPKNIKKAIKIYQQLTFTSADKSVKKKLVEIAKEFLGKGNIDDFRLAYENLDYGSISRKEFVEFADKLVIERLKGKTYSVIDKNVEHVYFKGDVFGKNLDERVAEIASSVGRHDFAVQTYLNMREYRKAFDSVMKIAGTGDLKEAFSLLQEITKKNNNELKPSRIETDKPEFYQTIASSVLSLYLINPEFDPETMKTLVNEKIFGKPLQDLTVKNNEGNLRIEIDFGNQKVVYEQQNIPGEKRNDVRLFKQKGLFPKDSALKFYEESQHAEDEAYWIGLLEGKLPVQKVVSSERFGDLRFNQIELCNGKPLENANYSTIRDAIDLSFKLYDAVSKGTHAKHMTTDFITERVSEFGMDADWIHDVLKQNEAGIVHNDYAPRNFMVDNKGLVPIDHECYVFGHPVAMAISMVNTHDNQITKEQGEELLQYARNKNPVSDDYVKAASLLWNCRQARRAQKGSEIRQYHEKRLEELK